MLLWGRDYVGAENPKVIARRRGADYVRAGVAGQAFATGAMLASIDRPTVLWLGVIILSLATPVLITGCIRHATHKHYHWKIGLMLGLLSLPGVVVLYCLPDQLSRLRRRRGFDVVMPRKVSSTWVVDPEDPDAPPQFRRGSRMVRYEEQSGAD
jgi:hypothetical protein